MKFLTGKGVVLKRLEARDLEQVRKWRNLPHVRDQMEFREHISHKMQLEWFSKVNNSQNWYFLFGEKENEWAGVVHIKDIDQANKTGEAGVFTGETAYLGSPLPVGAVLRMMDFAFSDLGLEKLEAKMRTDVPSILKFNTFLGYQPKPKNEAEGFVRMEVSKAEYFAATAKLR